MENILLRLKKETLVMDGAMGTYLWTKGLSKDLPPDLWNLEKPEIIQKVHQEYFGAGAEVLFTNTFGASRNRLKAYGLENKIEAINQQAVSHCRSVAKDNAYVAGSIGPIGSQAQPFSSLSHQEATDIYCEQINILQKSGVDLIVFETQFLEKEIRLACETANETFPNIPILLLMTVNENGMLLDKTNPADLIPFLIEKNIFLVGFNCSFGPQSLVVAFEKIKSPSFYLASKPNAGMQGGRISTKDFAQWGHRFHEMGICLLGGCCGTTPKDIRALSKALNIL